MAAVGEVAADLFDCAVELRIFGTILSPPLAAFVEIEAPHWIRLRSQAMVEEKSISLRGWQSV